MNFGMYQAIKVVVFIVFALYAVSLAFPFFWMLFNSVKPNGEFLSGNIFGLPEKATFKNYVNILQYRIGGESIFQMFLTSVVLTVLGTFVNVFFSTISAYCVAKYNFPGKKLVMGVAIFTMIIPIVGTLPAPGADDGAVSSRRLHGGRAVSLFGLFRLQLHSDAFLV